MTNRINELFREAGGRIEYDDKGYMWTYTEDFDFEIYAKSIIRECANQVDWILAEGGKTQGDLIKEHFGVEK